MTLSDVQLHAYIMFHLGYYVFKSFIVTCILHCDCFKSSINTNKVVIEIFYSNMLKLQCLSTWILVACESQACAPPPTFLTGGGGGNGMFVPPPTFNPTFLFSTLIICLYNTDKQLFGIFHIPINYLVDNFNKLTQMAVIK